MRQKTRYLRHLGDKSLQKAVICGISGDVPKTRSGKIMRRLLVDLSEGRPLGDTTSLQDETVPARIAAILSARNTTS